MVVARIKPETARSKGDDMCAEETMTTQNDERARVAREWLRAAVIRECAEGRHIAPRATVLRASGDVLGEAQDVIQGMAAIILDLVQRLGQEPSQPSE